MILGFGNNVVSALAGDITTIQTDIPVMPGTGLNLQNCFLPILKINQTGNASMQKLRLPIIKSQRLRFVTWYR